MAAGFQVNLSIQRPSQDKLGAFEGVNTTDISDVLHHSYTLDRDIAPAYSPITAAVGPAVTVSVPTGAQGVRKIAMNLTRPGDVLVVNARGNMTSAVLGGNLAQMLKDRGVAAVVIDGVIRDVTEIRDMGLPVYCRGVTTTAAPKDGPGEVNVPIACGGVVVNPGDVIVADEDGIVSIPQPALEEVISGVKKLTAKPTPQLSESGDVPGADDILKQLQGQGLQVTGE